MIRFEDTTYIIYLLSLLVIGCGYLWSRISTERWMRLVGQKDTLLRSIYPMRISKNLLRVICALGAFLLLVIALINPQMGRKKEKVNITNTDVVLALDISRSMLCEDIRPSRLQRSRLLADQLVENLRGERIGLVVFAGEAFVQVPLTMDYAALKLFISNANPDQIEDKSSDLVEAIRRSLQVFPVEEKRPGTIVLISDGEDISKDSLSVARQAAQSGYSIFTVGVGTTQGGMIPTSLEFHRDHEGKRVVTRLDAERLSDLAKAGKGQSYHISQSSQAIKKIVEHVQNIEKTESEQLSFSEYLSYYPYFLLVAILFLIVEFTLPWKVQTNLQNSNA